MLLEYTEVQERHEDIKRIAQTMTELQELFNDMAMLVSNVYTVLSDTLLNVLQ